jgi:hypothetical protein
MAKIKAPFTDEQVDRLHDWQGGQIGIRTGDGGILITGTHPFTCMGHDGCERPPELNDGELIPNNDGFVCPCGKYKQDWCHDFMANPPVVFPEPDGKSLFKRVVDLLKLAREKGYPKYNDLRPLIHMPFLRNDNLTFSAIITATIQQWLRLEKNVIVWIEPNGSWEGRELFVWFVKYYGTYNSNPSKRSSHLYELELIEGIEFALNALPPTNDTKS